MDDEVAADDGPRSGGSFCAPVGGDEDGGGSCRSSAALGFFPAPSAASADASAAASVSRRPVVVQLGVRIMQQGMLPAQQPQYRHEHAQGFCHLCHGWVSRYAGERSEGGGSSHADADGEEDEGERAQLEALGG